MHHIQSRTLAMYLGNMHRTDMQRLFDWLAASTLVIFCCLIMASCASRPSESSYNLGVEAYKKRNYSEAARQWTSSVGNGDIEAMNNLGYLLYNGYGVVKDTDRAVQLWKVAAEAGESEAQWHLGAAYETGVGTRESPSEAYAWYRCAIESASNNLKSKIKDHDSEAAIRSDATESLNKLKARISPSDAQRGEVLAGDYIIRYGKPPP
jgi:TPR repeat protein